MANSQNGYIANDVTRTQQWLIPGTTRKVRLRKGSPGALLVDLAAWFDKHIESVDGGSLDDWGYAEREIRGGTALSNHASGTALDLNAPRHPLGARNTFTDAQEKAIRARLKVYEGCIRWGGDYQNRADEMHFEIVEDVATCDRVLRKLSITIPKGSKPVTTTDPEDVDEYGAHVHAKQGAIDAKAALVRVEAAGQTIPEPPQVTGSGDAYYAHYWAKYGARLTKRLDERLAELGYPK